MPHQEKAIQSFVQHPDKWMNRTGVYANDSFRKLDEGYKTRLMEMGTKNITDDSYMKDLSNFMASPEIFGANPGQAKKLLDDFEISHSAMARQEEWKNLDPGTQKRLGDLYLAWKDDPAKTEDLWRFAADGAPNCHRPIVTRLWMPSKRIPQDGWIALESMQMTTSGTWMIR